VHEHSLALDGNEGRLGHSRLGKRLATLGHVHIHRMRLPAKEYGQTFPSRGTSERLCNYEKPMNEFKKV